MKLSTIEIKIQLLKRQITAAELARRWGVPRQNVTRVINRSKGFVFPEIKKNLAEFLNVPVSAIGRNDMRRLVKTR